MASVLFRMSLCSSHVAAYIEHTWDLVEIGGSRCMTDLVLKCEVCGASAQETEFSEKMKIRWSCFTQNHMEKVGLKNRHFLCRVHAPRQEVNPNPTICSTEGCPGEVETTTQLRKPPNKRLCEMCKHEKQKLYWGTKFSRSTWDRARP